MHTHTTVDWNHEDPEEGEINESEREEIINDDTPGLFDEMDDGHETNQEDDNYSLS